MTDSSQARLHQLVETWREQATGQVDWCEFNEGFHAAARACANELEDALDE